MGRPPPAGGAGAGEVKTATTAAVSVTVDNAPPVISSMSASGITSSSATISWTTDETSDSQVEYGTTTADRKSTRLNSSHSQISYAVFCLKKKKIGWEKTPSVIHL